jgi:hypothetical protein
MVDEDKRKAGRRRAVRRMSDVLHGVLTEEEREMTDRLLYGKYRAEDRRAHQRRSGVDRRACPEGATEPL